MSYLKKLDSLSKLKKNWDSYDSDPPSEKTIKEAKEILVFLLDNNFIPTRVNPSCMEGVAIAKTVGSKEVFIEIYNNHWKTRYMFCDDRSGEIITGKLEDLNDFLVKAKDYLNES